MIKIDNFKYLLKKLDFIEQDGVFSTTINDHEIKVDFKNGQIDYPKAIIKDRETTSNFSKNENFVVFECVYRLLKAGYQPHQLVLEPMTPGGHNYRSTYCDILVKDNNEKPYLLIECKTKEPEKQNNEFEKAWAEMQKDGGQLFNYFQSWRELSYLCLYTSYFYNQEFSEEYHLISLKDEDYNAIETRKNQLTFKDLGKKGKEEFFKVWSETYGKHCLTYNIFNSEVFKIGCRPYNINDLKAVNHTLIQKKYNQFATIMRQHNISGRENAFDKLVNLFLCKVVDEANNPDKLNFYWKGDAADDNFKFQDRLQKLYKDGMEKFLSEEVTYISEDEIENAFHLFKNKKDETKKTILEYFKQLKFYSNNAFAFLDVHNEKLFKQNAQVLKEVVQMLQDIKLQNEDEQHQFLGDLFEGFLDQGVKQSEGQFFTPMPIVKFLISSLPLKQILANGEPPKVIDYACGAGHFLTEYASQVKNILGKNKTLKEHYQNIYGIEKEYRLSKVAKVSAFMYGQDEINIIYADALETKKEIKNHSFNILVANPPYSVKGFLDTLSDEDKNKFKLYTDNKLNIDSFNSIETFFVERASQLLMANGFAVIVLPSSILTNGNIYIKCREIILQNFDILAIVEFGSGTFGRTGTNTATLFLRRKELAPNLANHYKNRIEEWFQDNESQEINAIFQDKHLLENYCNYCGFDFAEYQKFIKGKESAIYQTELFIDYRKKLKAPKAKSADKEQEFIKYAQAIEKEKLLYFMLAQGQSVLIVKSPPKLKDDKQNKAIKEFLGYEWSNAKGNEGIKYLGAVLQKEDEENSVKRNQGILNIQTPLFNPNNLEDESKINCLIRKHISGESVEIDANNQKFVKILPLTAMLDFSKSDFDKAIATKEKKAWKLYSSISSKRLKDIITIQPKSKIKVGEAKNDTTKNYPFYTSGQAVLTFSDYLVDGENIFLSTGGNAVVKFYSGKASYSTDTLAICSNNPDFLTKYAYYFLEQNIDYINEFLFEGVGLKHLQRDDFFDLKIPLPPLEIQQQIVAECEKVDNEFATSRMQIEEYKNKIAQVFANLEVITQTGGG